IQRSVHLIGLADIKGLMELRHVRQRAQHTILAGCMRVCDQLLTLRLFTRLYAPDLAPAKEKALLTGKAVNLRCRLTIQTELPGLVRYSQPAQIRNVFTQRQRSLNMQSG